MRRRDLHARKACGCKCQLFCSFEFPRVFLTLRREFCLDAVFFLKARSCSCLRVSLAVLRRVRAYLCVPVRDQVRALVCGRPGL
eukprot:2109805-Pleurochrysis_carterae.AAC.1